MNNYYKVGIVSFIGGFLIGLLTCYLTTPKSVPIPQIIEVEKYKIKEAQTIIDSLKVVGIARDKTIDSLKKIRHEKIINHKPLERVIINDSIRTKNLLRFIK